MKLEITTGATKYEFDSEFMEKTDLWILTDIFCNFMIPDIT